MTSIESEGRGRAVLLMRLPGNKKGLDLAA